MFLGHPSIRKRVGKKVCWVVVAWTRGEFRGMGGFFFFFFLEFFCDSSLACCFGYRNVVSRGFEMVVKWPGCKCWGSFRGL